VEEWARTPPAVWVRVRVRVRVRVTLTDVEEICGGVGQNPVCANLLKNYRKRLQTKATVPNINIDFLRCSNTYLQLYHTNK